MRTGVPSRPKVSRMLVLQIALVGEVEQLLVVAETDKRRGLGGSLGHVVDFQPLALVGGRLHPGRGLGQNVV